MVEAAESRLGFALPNSYLDVLRKRNGGRPRKRRFYTGFATSWAADHFEISAIRGIAGTWGIDTEGPLSTQAMIHEWAYPAIGIVICDMPSAGHDAVMLDYRAGTREPAAAYIDEDRVPRVIAETFANFVDQLE